MKAIFQGIVRQANINRLLETSLEHTPY